MFKVEVAKGRRGCHECAEVIEPGKECAVYLSGTADRWSYKKNLCAKCIQRISLELIKINNRLSN